MEFIDLASTIQNDEKNNRVIQDCKLINTRHTGKIILISIREFIQQPLLMVSL